MQGRNSVLRLVKRVHNMELPTLNKKREKQCHRTIFKWRKLNNVLISCKVEIENLGGGRDTFSYWYNLPKIQKRGIICSILVSDSEEPDETLGI